MNPGAELLDLEQLMSLEGLSRRLNLDHRVPLRSLLAGRHASSRRGRGMDFAEVRQYTRGDDIRNIDWKVTARTRATHSKVFSEETDRPAIILVDMSRAMGFGTTRTLKSVVAAEAAALLAFKIESEGDRFGAMIIHEEGYDLFRVQRNRKNTLAFLEAMVQRNSQLKGYESESRGEDSFPASLKRLRQLVTKDYAVFVISDFKRRRPEVTETLGHMARHNDLMLLRVSDPAEENLDIGDLPVSDGIDTALVKSSRRDNRSRWQRAFREESELFRVDMDRHRIPVVDLTTADPLQDQIGAILRSRGRG